MTRRIDDDAVKRRIWNIVEKWKYQGRKYDALLLESVIAQIVDTQPTLTPPNEPLTLEELRKMNGEPVWVKRLKGLSVCDTDWAVVEFRLEPDVKHDKIRVWWPGSEDEDTPSEDDYGKTWLAYRRPPEGEEDA